MIQSILGTPGQVKAAIRRGDRSPRALVLLMVLGKVSRLAASGQHHIYRGVLAMSGTGLRNLLLCWLDELVNLKQFTPEERTVFILASMAISKTLASRGSFVSRRVL